MTNDDDAYGFASRFRGFTLDELIGAFNREVGNRGWVGARGVYLVALSKALLATGLDCSEFIQDNSMSLNRRIRLEGRRLVPIDNTPPVAREPDARVARVVSDRELVYREVPHNDGLVFARPGKAEEVARIHSALETSKTWGDFKAAMPAAEYAELVSMLEEDWEAVPEPSAPFTPDQIPWYCDGDYPRWLQQDMDRLLPDDLLREFGVRESTVLNGDYWEIPAARAEEVCEALRARGFRVTHRPDLKFF